MDRGSAWPELIPKAFHWLRKKKLLQNPKYAGEGPFSTIAEKEEWNMTELTRDKELDALKADIARLREEISGLVAGATNATGTQTARNNPEGGNDATEGEGPVDGTQDHDMWADLLHTFATSKAQGEKVFKKLAAEIEQHPMVSILAAFGLGYIIAKLWHEGDNR